jgi:hypothetical protein
MIPPMSRRCRWSRAGCFLALGVATATAMGMGMARTAAACGPLGPAALSAFPGAGATDVPPPSSIVVIGGPNRIPVGLTLEAAGVVVPLPTPQPIGAGRLAGAAASFFRLPGPLTPSTAYVLRVAEPGATAPRELTRFTTAAAYDKPMGVAPRIDRLRLWRVRYPVAQIDVGGCVFDQYHGYIDVDYQDGTVPGTPADEVIGTLSLLPENGTFAQTWVFAGGRFEGHTPEIPEGGTPQPQSATWRPELVPDRRYCVTLQQEGRNDLAILPLRSNTACAEVINLDLSGGDGGVVADAGADGGERADAKVVITGTPTDAEQMGGGTTERGDKRGCAYAGNGAPRSASWFVLLAGLVFLRRRQQR